ncbi:hypothetical protein ACNKHM_20140 [Shigella sonnei]
MYDVFRLTGYRLFARLRNIGTWAPALLLLARLFQDYPLAENMAPAPPI